MQLKKRLVLALCVVFLVSILYGCGKSDAVKNVEALINEIGDVTLESEEAINNAEKAYNALSDKEKGQVENEELLSEKKKELQACIQKAEEEKEKARQAEEARVLAERKEKLAPFVGKWVSLYKDVVYDEYIHVLHDREDVPTMFFEISADNQNVIPVDDKTIEFKSKGNFHLVEDHGITKLVDSNSKNVLVRESEYEESFNKMFEHVYLNTENIGDYIGDIAKVGKFLNTWGDETDSDVYTLKSNAYDNKGLIMLYYNDVKFEYFVKGMNDPVTYTEPYPFVSGYGDPHLDHFGRVEGDIWYVKKEFVSNIRFPSESESKAYSGERWIKFSDGYESYFSLPGIGIVNGISFSDEPNY